MCPVSAVHWHRQGAETSLTRYIYNVLSGKNKGGITAYSLNGGGGGLKLPAMPPRKCGFSF
jgi:hypothetical protein